MIKKKLGKRVRHFRNKKGLTQGELALLCGVDRTYITSIECGRRNVSIMNIEKIANALEVDIKELFNFDY